MVVTNLPTVFTCSHNGCDATLHNKKDDNSIPSGWTIGQIEEYRDSTVALYYIYLCPRHTLTSAERQTSLPFPTDGAHV